MALGVTCCAFEELLPQFGFSVLAIDWAFDSTGTTIEHVSRDHGGLHIAVPQEFLNSADVVPILKQMCSKAMTKGMAACVLTNTGFAYGLLRRANWP